MPTPNELHVDRYLTDVSVDFTQEGFVHNQVFPVVPVQKQSDLYVIYDRGSFWRDEMPVRPLGGEADAADWTFSEGSYFCRERAKAHMIDDRQRANTDDPIQQDLRASKLLTEGAMITNDRLWAGKYFQSGVWTTDLTGVASGPSVTQFIKFSESGSDPIGEIDKRKEEMTKLTARMPNTMIVGSKAHRVIRNHTEIREQVKYTQIAGSIGNQQLADLFEVDKYVVARSVYNSAAEGLADSFDFVFNDSAILLVYAADSPGIDTPSAGYTFAWTGLLGGESNSIAGAIMRGRKELAFSDVFVIRTAHDMNLVSADLGIFMADAV